MIARALMTLSITTLLTTNAVLGGWLAVISYLVVRDALERGKR